MTRLPLIVLLAALSLLPFQWPTVSGGALAQAPDLSVPATDPRRPAVARGGRYMGFEEQFNRAYTDPSWRPSRIIYVSPDGRGDGGSRESPTSFETAIAAARPGTLIYALRGRYQGCYGFTPANGGTYDDPVAVLGERNPDGSIGVVVQCCSTGRQSCFNLEAASYVAIDSFELIGGRYGVRAVGSGYAASEHSRGVAVLNCRGHDQSHDPFFSGAADWAVWERNVAYGAKEGDGHGIYLSNGSDWNIVRFNETFGNVSSDFQVNADPASTCQEVGIPFADPRCDAYAGTGEGGQGASDYFLIDSNHFHHGLGNGANFTSLRRSVIRNNIFGVQARHGVSFWQETDNPKLGSSENRVVHNLFVTTGRHAVQFIQHSTRNEFANNVLLGLAIAGGAAAANPAAVLMQVDGTVGGNVYRANLYVAGRIEGRSPSGDETVRPDFSAAWFARFPVSASDGADGYRPTTAAPFLDRGPATPFAPTDRNGSARSGRVDLGPLEVR